MCCRSQNRKLNNGSTSHVSEKTWLRELYKALRFNKKKITWLSHVLWLSETIFRKCAPHKNVQHVGWASCNFHVPEEYDKIYLLSITVCFYCQLSTSARKPHLKNIKGELAKDFMLKHTAKGPSSLWKHFWVESTMLFFKSFPLNFSNINSVKNITRSLKLSPSRAIW